MSEINIQSLKKKYSYYNKILNDKGLNDKQKKIYDDIINQLGDNIPKHRKSKLTDEERKANRKKYYESHKEQIKEYSTSWNKKNKDKVAAYNKASYQKKKQQYQTMNE